MSKKWNILVADDDPLVRTTLKESLEEVIGCNVYTACDGVEALSMLKGLPIDCCFVDILMPRLDGLELVGKIKEHDNILPVVIITGRPSFDLAVDTMRRGASDFLVKPFSLNDIMLTFERVTRERSLLIENVFLREEIQRKQSIDKLNKELRQKVLEVTQFNEVMEELFRVKSSEELFQCIVDVAARVTLSNSASFMVIDRDKNKLVMIAATPSRRKWVGKVSVNVGEWISGKVASDGVALLIEDINSLPQEAINCLNRKNDGVSFISLPVKIKEEVFGVLNCTDKQDGTAYSDNGLSILNFLVKKVSLTIENLALYESLSHNLFSTLYTLVETIEARDPYTREHSRRVTDLAVKIARHLGCHERDLEMLTFAGYLHDIGKIGVRDNILLKPSKLNKDEMQVIQLHPVIGANIIKHLGFLHREQAIIRHHHERWDGSGYPDGLKGEGIPRFCRIIAVADAFDAMTSDRPYRPARGLDDALACLQEEAGKQFDGQIVLILEQLIYKSPVANKCTN
ncbi:MAG: HD domain-containing phosphohydrolase [Pseudomonadota bacterium]